MYELAARRLRRLRQPRDREIMTEVQAISGLVPPEVDVEQALRDYCIRKHSR